MQNFSSCSPDELLERVKGDDPAVLGDLFECYRHDLMGFLQTRCGQLEDAEDALQDAFVQAARYLADFRGEGSLKSWLYRLAGSACTRMRRGRKRDPQIHAPLDEGGLTVAPSGHPASPSAVLEAMEGRLEARLAPLRQALEELTAADRAVLILRDGNGMTAREVAEALDLTESAVKSRLHRARRTVREVIGTGSAVASG